MSAPAGWAVGGVGPFACTCHRSAMVTAQPVGDAGFPAEHQRCCYPVAADAEADSQRRGGARPSPAPAWRRPLGTSVPSRSTLVLPAANSPAITEPSATHLRASRVGDEAGLRAEVAGNTCTA